jgi:hypothetical protein
MAINPNLQGCNCKCSSIFHYGIIDDLDATPSITNFQNAYPTPRHEGSTPESTAMIFRNETEEEDYTCFATAARYGSALPGAAYTRMEHLNTETLSRNSNTETTSNTFLHPMLCCDNSTHVFIYNHTEKRIDVYSKSDLTLLRSHSVALEGASITGLGIAASNTDLYILLAKGNLSNSYYIEKYSLATGTRSIQVYWGDWELTSLSGDLGTRGVGRVPAGNYLAWSGDKLLAFAVTGSRDSTNTYLFTYASLPTGRQRNVYLVQLNDNLEFINAYSDINPIATVAAVLLPEARLIPLYKKAYMCLVSAGSYVILNRFTFIGFFAETLQIPSVAYTGEFSLSETWIEAFDPSSGTLTRLKQTYSIPGVTSPVNHGIAFAGDYDTTRGRLVIAVNGYRNARLDSSRIAEYIISGTEQTPQWLVDPIEDNQEREKMFNKCFYHNGRVVFSKNYFKRS